MWDVDFQGFVANCFKDIFLLFRLKNQIEKRYLGMMMGSIFTLSFRISNPRRMYPEKKIKKKKLDT